MSNTHHLTNKLKSLKLGGMLDTLELRLKQVQQDNLGYIEFLEFLLEDELQRRANRRLQLRVAQAHFEEVKTLETFDFAFNSKTPTRQIMDLATCQFIERKEWALFVGPVGVGKSYFIKAKAIRHVGWAIRYCIPEPLACCPTSAVAMPTVPGTAGCGATSNPMCSFSTISP